MSRLDVCHRAEVIGKVRWRYTLDTFVNEKGELLYLNKLYHSLELMADVGRRGQ